MAKVLRKRKPVLVEEIRDFVSVAVIVLVGSITQGTVESAS
jgi:hypothetical protein